MTKKEIEEEIEKAKEKTNEPKKENKEYKSSQKEHKKEDYLEMIQMLQAELENYRKRVERDKQEFCNYASREIMDKLLPALDNFDLAIKNKDNENKEEFVKAIEMVHNQLLDILKKEGLDKIETKGDFNPELHEPILQEESDKKPNTILEEIQSGYIFKGKILRHAKVKLAKQKNQDKKEDKNQGGK